MPTVYTKQITTQLYPKHVTMLEQLVVSATRQALADGRRPASKSSVIRALIEKACGKKGDS